MSGSDWDKRLTPVAAAGLSMLAVIGASVLMFSLGRLSGQQQERADTTYRYAHSAKESAQRECVNADPSVVFECVVEKVESSSQAEHDKRDLTAQQEAAWAGIFSSVWSLGALIATVLGLIWIKGTLDATRKGAEATQGTVDETRRIGEAQTRCYLSIVAAKVMLKGDIPIVIVTLKNTGQSPALKVSLTYYFKPSIIDKVMLADPPKAISLHRETVAAHDTIEAAPWHYEMPLSDEMIKCWRGDTVAIVGLYVEAEGRDVFGHPVKAEEGFMARPIGWADGEYHDIERYNSAHGRARAEHFYNQRQQSTEATRSDGKN